MKFVSIEILFPDISTSSFFSLKYAKNYFLTFRWRQILYLIVPQLITGFLYFCDKCLVKIFYCLFSKSGTTRINNSRRDAICPDIVIKRFSQINIKKIIVFKSIINIIFNINIPPFMHIHETKRWMKYHRKVFLNGILT